MARHHVCDYAHHHTITQGVEVSVDAGLQRCSLNTRTTSGMTFHTGRAMARALIPQAMELVAAGWDTGRVTSRTVGWDAAPEAVLHQETKLVISRADA